MSQLIEEVSTCAKFRKLRKEQEEHLKFVEAIVFEKIIPFCVCIIQLWYPANNHNS